MALNARVDSFLSVRKIVGLKRVKTRSGEYAKMCEKNTFCESFYSSSLPSSSSSSLLLSLFSFCHFSPSLTNRSSAPPRRAASITHPTAAHISSSQWRRCVNRSRLWWTAHAQRRIRLTLQRETQGVIQPRLGQSSRALWQRMVQWLLVAEFSTSLLSCSRPAADGWPLCG